LGYEKSAHATSAGTPPESHGIPCERVTHQLVDRHSQFQRGAAIVVNQRLRQPDTFRLQRHCGPGAPAQNGTLRMDVRQGARGTRLRRWRLHNLIGSHG
jgi:hypothetical protein